MADSNDFFGIEDTFSESNKVNDIIFSDARAEDLVEIEKAKAKEIADAKKLADEKATLAAKGKKSITPVKTEDEDEENKPLADVNSELFGKTDGDGEEEDKSTEDKDEDKENTEEEDKDLTQFEILSKSLYAAGVFVPDIDPDTDEEVTHTAKTPEEFKKLFEYQKQAGMYAMLDNHLSRFGQDRQELFDAIFNKGVEPKEYLPVYNRVQDFKSLTTETEANQERIVSEAYRRQGLPEDKIPTKIQRLKDMAELQSEADDMLPVIIAQDEKALRDQEATKLAGQEADKQRDASYKNSLVKIISEKMKAKEFDGIPVSEQTAQKTFDFLYNKKWQGADGKKFTDFDKFILELNKPENHALKVKVGLLAQNQFDLSKVQKKAVSKESSELFSEFATKKSKQANKKAPAPAPWNL